MMKLTVSFGNFGNVLKNGY